MVRVPGFEPGFPRWQRGVITATLHSRSLLQDRPAFLSVGTPVNNRIHSRSNFIPRFSIGFNLSTKRVFQPPILVYWQGRTTNATPHADYFVKVLWINKVYRFRMKSSSVYGNFLKHYQGIWRHPSVFRRMGSSRRCAMPQISSNSLSHLASACISNANEQESHVLSVR